MKTKGYNMKNIINTKIKFILAFIIIILTINFFINFHFKNYGADKQRWVSHTNLVIHDTQLLLNTINLIETQQRGFLLTSDIKYLGDYDDNLKNIKNTYNELKNLTLDNNTQQNRLKKLKKFIDLKILELNKTINLQKNNKLADAMHIVKTDDGKVYMDNIINILKEFIKEEKKLLTLRENDYNDNSNNNMAIFKLTISILLLILFYILYKINHQKNELIETRERLSLAIDGSGNGLWDLNLLTNEVFYSKKWKSMLGFRDEEIKANLDEWSKRVHPDDLTKAMKDIEDHLARKTDFYSNEHRMLCKDGTYIWIHGAGKALFDEDSKAIRMLGFNTDITKTKVIEQNLIIEKENAQQASIAKSEFLANMSHEIRTPLNAIMGFIDLLKNDEKNEDKIKYLETIDTSSNNLLEIINDILDFSKIETNLIELEYRDYSPLDEFKSIVELFKARVLEKNITLNVDIDKNLPKYIKSDALRIKQVIINLLSNAIKFTNNNKTISFKVEFKDKNLSVYVKDEGIGIRQDKVKTIFEPFTQADNSTTRKFGGTGLGLTISSKLIEALKGELKVKSTLDLGSEFYFTIPIEVVDIKPKKEEIINADIKLSGHILLVEDNKANQMFMKVILKKMGFTFDIAFNGLEALEKFPRVTCENGATIYDAILMDENMPSMNGIEATKRILEIEKELSLPHTPIIALTANALKGDRERFLNAGMDEYITKPVDKKKLSEILNQVL